MERIKVGERDLAKIWNGSDGSNTYIEIKEL